MRDQLRQLTGWGDPVFETCWGRKLSAYGLPGKLLCDSFDGTTQQLVISNEAAKTCTYVSTDKDRLTS